MGALAIRYGSADGNPRPFSAPRKTQAEIVKFRPRPREMERFDVPKGRPRRGMVHLPGKAPLARRALRMIPYSPLKVIDYGLDVYDYFEEYYRQPAGSPGGWVAPEFPTHGRCYHYQQMGGYSPDCNYGASYYTTSTSNTSNDCHTWHYPAQATITGPANGAFNIPPQTRGAYLMVGATRGGIYGCARMNYEHVWHWWRKAGQTAPFPGARIYPRIQPLPYAVPEPVPYLDPVPFTNPAPARAPRLAPNARLAPGYVIPASTLEISPSGVPRLNKDSAHKRVPPSSGENEKKGLIFRKAPAIAAAGGLYGGATEIIDALDALGDALPDSLARAYRKQKTIQDKARFLFRNWRKIDAVSAAYNLASNHITDAAIGKANNALAGAIKRNPYYRGANAPTISRNALRGTGITVKEL